MYATDNFQDKPLWGFITKKLPGRFSCEIVQDFKEIIGQHSTYATGYFETSHDGNLSPDICQGDPLGFHVHCWSSSDRQLSQPNSNPSKKHRKNG
jgi:hypothetical protein